MGLDSVALVAPGSQPPVTCGRPTGFAIAPGAVDLEGGASGRAVGHWVALAAALEPFAQGGAGWLAGFLSTSPASSAVRAGARAAGHTYAILACQLEAPSWLGERPLPAPCVM